MMAMGARAPLQLRMSVGIGETEENLAALFDAAEASCSIILLDEADSMFGKRTDVKSSNDRYANLETNYLLQRLETYTGVCLLTSNHEANIDAAAWSMRLWGSSWRNEGRRSPAVAARTTIPNSSGSSEAPRSTRGRRCCVRVRYPPSGPISGTGGELVALGRLPMRRLVAARDRR